MPKNINTAVIEKMVCKVCNIRLTLMFIYIYQDVLLALSMNERGVYSASFLSEYV